jgi:hypothetical protein
LELLGNVNRPGQRRDLHLSHNLQPVGFHRALGRAEFSRLEGVFRFIKVTEDADANPEDQPAMPLHQRGKSSFISGRPREAVARLCGNVQAELSFLNGESRDRSG